MHPFGGGMSFPVGGGAQEGPFSPTPKKLRRKFPFRNKFRFPVWDAKKVAFPPNSNILFCVFSVNIEQDSVKVL